MIMQQLGSLAKRQFFEDNMSLAWLALIEARRRSMMKIGCRSKLVNIGDCWIRPEYETIIATRHQAHYYDWKNDETDDGSHRLRKQITGPSNQFISAKPPKLSWDSRLIIPKCSSIQFVCVRYFIIDEPDVVLGQRREMIETTMQHLHMLWRIEYCKRLTAFYRGNSARNRQSFAVKKKQRQLERAGITQQERMLKYMSDELLAEDTDMMIVRPEPW